MAATSWAPTCQTLRPWPAGCRKWMCVPALPAGWGPSNSSIATRSARGARSVEPGARQTYTVPGVRSRRARMPRA